MNAKKLSPAEAGATQVVGGTDFSQWAEERSLP